MKPSDITNESLTKEGMWDNIKSKFSKPAPAVWKSPRAPLNTPAATSPQAAASNAVQNQTAPSVWKNARNPGVAAATPQAAAPVQAQPQQPQQAQPSATQQSVPAQQPAQAPDFSKSLMGQNAGYKSATMNAPTAFNAAAQNTVPGATATPAATVQQPTMQTQEPVATEPETTAKEKPAAEPAATTKKQSTAGKLARGAANAAKSGGGGLWQGVKDLFDPDARVASATNKSANAVRADAIKREMGNFQQVIRGFDPSDSAGIQGAFVDWARGKYPQVDKDTLEQIAQDIDPKKPGTITRAVGSAYNSQVTNSATMSPAAKRKSEIRRKADDEAEHEYYKQLKQQEYKPEKQTRNIARNVVKRGDVGRLIHPGEEEPISIGPDKLDPNDPNDAKLIQLIKQQSNQSQETMSAPDEVGQLDQIKTQIKALDDRKQQLQQFVDAVEKRRTASAEPQQANQPNTAAGLYEESKDFGAMVWKKLRECK